MSDAGVEPGGDDDGVNCCAKLARVVLENRGPLSASELADEARLDPATAADALAELAEAGLAEAVCGVRDRQEEVYELTEGGLQAGNAGVPDRRST